MTDRNFPIRDNFSRYSETASRSNPVVVLWCTVVYMHAFLINTKFLFTVPVIDLSDSGLSPALSQADPCC